MFTPAKIFTTMKHIQLPRRQNQKTPISKIIIAIVFVTILTVALASGYFYWQQRSFTVANASPEKNQQEMENVLKQISKSITLPSEAPEMATVTDKSKLQNQPFFSQAENGDKVLIFTQARKAILYRPQTKKIIDFTLINVQSEATSSSKSTL